VARSSIEAETGSRREKTPTIPHIVHGPLGD
jgi:hypothetical protein